MENAKSIQTSIVPTTFPKYQDQEPFGLYASMDTAEAVGGDFYDFFMRDEKTLVIVMADVSGKGMPAALYMMRAKTLIRTFAEQGLCVEEVAERANQELCEDNTAAMFVTAWIGFLDLDTGVLSFVHAGHTYPVLVREKTTDQGTSEDEVFFIEKEIDMVLGGIEEIDYTRQEITLQHGDSIYLYTDGVTEAMDIADHTYDEKRLLQLIREKAGELKGNDKNDYCKAACQMVYDDVKKYKMVRDYIRERHLIHQQKGLDFFKKGVKDGYFRDDIDYELISRLAEDVSRLVMESSMYSEYSLEHVFRNIFFLFFRGFSTPKGIEVMDSLLAEER